MIEQQYYTRERGGLFNQTDGYDTVAKSPQLKLDYIKKNLHPICSYDIPPELQKTGEQNESKYPPNFMVMPQDSGETIVGQAIFKSKDFTGLRSTFFMHNYIFSEKERRRYVKEPEKLFGITGFADHYDFSEGRQLPTLAAIPYEVPYLFTHKEQLFEEIGMTEKLFAQLIYAAFATAYSKKKIFIVLNVSIEKLGDYAKALLYHLYCALPWRVAECLGISTYQAKAEARKGIQITFLDKEALQQGSKISKEYIFDFVNQRFLNCEEEAESAEYIKIALKYAANKVAWEKYNELTDELESVLKSTNERGIIFYGRVALLFEMNLFLKGKKFYELTGSMRKDLLKQMLVYCKSKLPDEMLKEMIDLMEYGIGLIHEPINKGILWGIEEVKVVLEYKLQLFINNKDQFMHCQQIILCLLGEAAKEKQVAYEDEVIRETRYYLGFYQQLFKEIYKDQLLRNGIAYRQIENSLKGVSSVHELMNVMEQWEPIEEILFSDSFYKDLVKEKFLQVIEKENDKVKLLQQVQRWCKRHQGQMYEELLGLEESYFLNSIDLQKEIKSEQELCSLSFQHQYQEENYEMIRLYQELRTDISSMGPNRVRVNEKVQQLIKHFYEQAPSSKDFYMLVYAFLKRGEDGQLRLQFKKVLFYLYGINKDLMFEFIIWSKGQEVYIDKGRFDSEVIRFFEQMREKKIKIPKDEIRMKLGQKAKTRILAEKLIRNQQSSFVNFLSDHTKGAVMAVVLIIAAGGLGGAYGWYIQTQREAALEETFSTQMLSDEAIGVLMQHLSCATENVEETANKFFEEKAEQEEKNDNGIKDNKEQKDNNEEEDSKETSNEKQGDKEHENELQDNE